MKLDERARKNLGVILRGLASVGQVNVAKALDVSESSVSRFKDSEAPSCARLISVCGLKVVPATYKCVKPEVMHTLLELAGQRIDELRRDPEGIFEDPE